MRNEVSLFGHILILVYYTLLYIRTSKLKPKLMALNSIRFSFNRKKILVTRCGLCLNLY